MKFELFISRRLKLGAEGEKASSPSLTVAVIGMTLAIVVMILSITIVCGFKREITNKIYALDSHVRVSNAGLPGYSRDIYTVHYRDIAPIVMADSCHSMVSSISLIAEKPAILKTEDDFKGVVYRGVDSGFDWTYLRSSLLSGRIPNLSDTANISEVIISKIVADQLHLKTGDRILTYFIDSHVKVRNSRIVGVFSTDFDQFDGTYILGNVKLIQNVNGWDPFTGTYVGINTNDIDNVKALSYHLYSTLARSVYHSGGDIMYNVTDTTMNNRSFFSWLNLLNMNVLIIIILMAIVSAFTLIAGLLMIVLERIRMIGILKTLGAVNNSIRRIFIYLTQRLIIRSILWGNGIGIALSLIQQYFHIIRLNAAAYYMPYVPIYINWWYILLLNVGIIVISYLTLIGPSYIISTIKPTTTIRFE
jgi:lipoprotein-releasing system permease protein